jgi:hypothetical protein
MDNFSALLGKKLAGSGGSSGTSNYNELENKPQINGQTLNGDKTAASLGLQPAINQNNKLDADLLDDSESEKKLVSENDISNWNNKYDSDDAYTKAQTDAAIETAINGLAVAETGGTGKVISAISETDGKISATATTMDTTPTANSQNPVTSGGVAASQAAQDAEIAVIANAGAKNLFKNTAVSKTYLGVTFTVNEDGTVSLSGAATTAAGVLEIGTVTPPAGSYIVSGCPAGGSWAPNPNKYRIRIEKNGAWLGDETGTGYTVTVNGSDVISLQINSGVGVDTAGLVFKPMIRPATITDSTYEPYALPNPVITPALIKHVDEGAKNIADFTSATKTTYTTITYHGVTITRNGDIFTISGTSDTNDNAFFNIYYEGSATTKIIPPGNWVALIENYTGDVVKDIAVQVFSQDVTPKVYGVPIQFSLSGSETGNWLRVNLRPSTTYNGSFRLMICSQEDYAVSPKFVPYRPSWQEMWEMIQELQSGTRSLSLSAPSENLSKGAIDTAEEPEILTKAEADDDVHAEIEKPDEVYEIEEKEGAEER